MGLFTDKYFFWTKQYVDFYLSFLLLSIVEGHRWIEYFELFRHLLAACLWWILFQNYQGIFLMKPLKIIGLY